MMWTRRPALAAAFAMLRRVLTGPAPISLEPRAPGGFNPDAAPVPPFDAEAPPTPLAPVPGVEDHERRPDDTI